MTVPVRHPRRQRSGRRFDLRATALFFGFAAVGLCVAGWIVRTALDVAERRPAWAFVLALVAVAAVVLGRRGRSRLSVLGLARRTTGALEEGAETALDALEATRTVAPAARRHSSPNPPPRRSTSTRSWIPTSSSRR